MTSSNANVAVDKRCKRARSNVNNGHVGSRIPFVDEEQTPWPRVNDENDIVAAGSSAQVWKLQGQKV